MKKLLFALCLVLLASFVFSHGTAEEHAVEPQDAFLAFFEAFPSIDVIFWALLAIILVAVLSVFMGIGISESHKKLLFGIIIVLTVIPTAYITFATVYENTVSVTGGPVHWHADFEIWSCGERLELLQSEGFSNKIGTELFHHHNDYRIHVEGTVQDFQHVSLGKFFTAINGSFSREQLTVLLNDGSVFKQKNGDVCSGTPGQWFFFVNKEVNTEFDDYVIAPYGSIPPGDFLHFVFAESLSKAQKVVN